QDVRRGHVPPGHPERHRRRQGEAAAPPHIEQGTEHARRVQVRQREPVDRPVVSHQCHRPPITDRGIGPQRCVTSASPGWRPGEGTDGSHGSHPTSGRTPSPPPPTTRGGSPTPSNGPPPARRRGTTSPPSPASAPSAPHSTCTTPTSNPAAPHPRGACARRPTRRLAEAALVIPRLLRMGDRHRRAAEPETQAPRRKIATETGPPAVRPARRISFRE